MTREELRDYVEEQRNLGIIPYHVYSALIDGIDTLEQEPFDGMTNREIISEFVERDDSFAIMVDEVNGTVNIELSLDFWNASYKRGET